MQSLIINGVITTVGPLSIAMPEQKDFDSFPVMARSFTSDGEPMKTGYLPATTIRGFLRRAVVMNSMKMAAEAGSPYSLPKAYDELIGQNAESEQQAGDIDLVALKKARESSPVLDLFGTGLGIASRLRVSHFLPDNDILPTKFFNVRKDLGDSEGALESLSEQDREDYYQRNQANRSRAQSKALVDQINRDIRAAERKNERTEELAKQLQEAKKLLERHEGEMRSMEVSSKAIFSHYALPVGVNLKGRLVVVNPKDRDLEMLEFGLDALSKDPVLGAHSARGCGEIKGNFDVLIDGELKKKIQIGDYMAAEIDQI